MTACPHLSIVTCSGRLVIYNALCGCCAVVNDTIWLLKGCLLMDFASYRSHSPMEDWRIFLFLFFSFAWKNYWQSEKKFSCEKIGMKYNLKRGSFKDQPYNFHILRIISFAWQLTNGFGFSHTGGNILHQSSSKLYIYNFFFSLFFFSLGKWNYSGFYWLIIGNQHPAVIFALFKILPDTIMHQKQLFL